MTQVIGVSVSPPDGPPPMSNSSRDADEQPKCVGFLDDSEGHWQMDADIVHGLGYLADTYRSVHPHITLLICVVGTLLNIVHIKVLLTERLRVQPINTLLTLLALCQMAEMGLYIVYQLKIALADVDICQFSTYYTFGWMMFLKAYSWLNLWLHTTSLWLVMGMAALRFRLIRRKRLSQRPVIGVPQTIAVAASLASVLLLVCLPTFLMQNIIEVDATVNYERYNCTPRLDVPGQKYVYYWIDVSRNPSLTWCYSFNANLLVSGVLFKVVPCVALLGLSAQLIHALHLISQQRAALVSHSAANLTNAVTPSTRNTLGPGTQTSTAGSRQQQSTGNLRHASSTSSIFTWNKCNRQYKSNTTRVLILVVFMFILAELPHGLLLTTGSLWTSIYHQLYNVLADFLDVIALLNSTASFALYCSMNSFYRLEFSRMMLDGWAWLTRRPHAAHTAPTAHSVAVATTKGQNGHAVRKRSSHRTQPSNRVQQQPPPQIVVCPSESGTDDDDQPLSLTLDDALPLPAPGTTILYEQHRVYSDDGSFSDSDAYETFL